MDDGTDLIGVVGDPPAGLEAEISDLDVHYRAGDVDSVLSDGPDIVVAIGEPACLDAARACPGVPLVAVDAGRGVPSVPRTLVTDVLRDILEESARTVTIPVLSVDHDGERVGSAVADVTLLSAEVAHISEYSVRAGETHVSQFRADGVVVATPVGSTGYAERVGSPVIAPETGVGAVVPIAPFATDPDHWVVALTDVYLSVKRDDTQVTLLADDREVATVSKGESVHVTTAGTADFVVAPETLSRFS